MSPEKALKRVMSNDQEVINKIKDQMVKQYHKKCWKYIQDEKWRQVSYVLDAETNHDF